MGTRGEGCRYGNYWAEIVDPLQIETFKHCFQHDLENLYHRSTMCTEYRGEMRLEPNYATKGLYLHARIRDIAPEQIRCSRPTSSDS